MERGVEILKGGILVILGIILLSIISTQFYTVANPYSKKYLNLDLTHHETSNNKNDDYDPFGMMYQILYLNELGKSSK